MKDFEQRVIDFLRQAARLTREEIWRGEDVYWPTVRKEFARYPQLAFVGANYSPGGWVLVGANPNSTEGQNRDFVDAKYRQKDRENVRLFRAFLNEGSSETYKELQDFRRADIRSWAMDWCISGTLDRLSLDLDDVVLCNVVPFSTQNAPPMRSAAWKNSVGLYFSGLLRVLQPHSVVWLGKAGFERSKRHFEPAIQIASAVVSRQRSLSLEGRFRDLDRLIEAHQ